MSSGKKIFIVGPGFAGWAVLELLVREGYTVSGLVRRESHAEGIKASGASAVLGDLNDKTLITSNVVNHDIVLHTATADHLPSVEAILDGVKQRAAKGLSTIYIHMSGASIQDDNAWGAFKTEKIYNDKDRADIDAIPETAPHRNVDTYIVKQQKEIGEKAKIAIMVPPLIYGYIPKHDRLTIQIPSLTRFAIKNGYAGHIGKGLSVTSNVHVLDLADAFLILLRHLESSTPAQVLENPFYYPEGSGDKGEASWRDIAALIGKQLHAAGKIQDPVPKTIPESAYGDLLYPEFAGAIYGLNTRCRGLRLRELGWKPKQKSWDQAYVEDEFPQLLKEANK